MLELSHFRVVKSLVLDHFKAANFRSTIIDCMKQNPPDVLWISVPDMRHSMSKDESQKLAIVISVLLQIQLDAGRQVMLAGCLTESDDWHPELLSRALNHPRLNASHVYWLSLIHI